MRAFNRKMTNEEIEEMEKNRLHMLSIKRWFEFVILFELVCAVYCASTSVFGVAAAAVCVIYLFFINRKDPEIIKKAIAGHFIIALVIIGVSVSNCVEIYSGDTSGKMSGVTSMVANGLTSVSPEAAEELKDYDLVTEEETESGVEVAKKLIGSVVVINLICSVLITVPPIFLNAVLVKKCGEYYSLSDKPGFPQFMTIIESRDAFRYSEAVKNIENYNSAYGVERSAYAAERSTDAGTSVYGDTMSAAVPSAEAIPEYHDERSFADRAINNEGTQYIKDMILKYREQITKTPENVFDYTVLSSLIVYINAILGLHIMAFVFALLEIIIVLFFLLPRNYKHVYAAFVFHILESITILGGGITKEGIFGQFVFVFTGILSVVQVVFYFMTARMLKEESDAEFERQRQLRKERAEAERQRKIIEEEDRIRQDIERRKVAASGNYGMEAVSPAVPVTNEDVPQQNYSSWSKVDTDLASSMLSDLNE